MDLEITTDKNGRTIKVGDYVQKVNRITGSIEDSGVVTMIIGNHVYLGAGYVDGKLINLIYFSDELIVK
jgi:hypothetical protein